MPFIEEDKFKLMQEDLDNATLKREEAENELSQAEEALTSFKKKSKITPIVLGLLLGAALGAAYYFYTSNGNLSFSTEDDSAVIRKSERTRVLDSIKRADARARRNNTADGGSNNNSIVDLQAETSRATIYSVQIGVFSNKKHPLLSSTTIPSTVTENEGYFKYSIGLFATLNEAKFLKRELIKIGFKDAFIASYIDGERQKIHN
jgi:hypothetical protein